MTYSLRWWATSPMRARVSPDVTCHVSGSSSSSSNHSSMNSNSINTLSISSYHTHTLSPDALPAALCYFMYLSNSCSHVILTVQRASRCCHKVLPSCLALSSETRGREVCSQPLICRKPVCQISAISPTNLQHCPDIKRVSGQGQEIKLSLFKNISTSHHPITFQQHKLPSHRLQ